MAGVKALQPGELTKPVRVWCSSSSIRIGWFQAEPISEQVTVFYKKTGSLFGTEVVLPTASLIGPDLSMSGPPVSGGGRADYFELDIRKLKPGTQYVVKVRAHSGSHSGSGQQAANGDDPGPGGESGPGAGPLSPGPGNMSGAGGIAAAPAVTSSVRSERLSTLGLQEEEKRNVDMTNFIGALIKLGDYDGTIVSFAATTGLYEVRILQVDEAGSTPQLVRLASEYTDLGLPARTYTLSSIRFGRWGGEISNSQVVAEGELRWIVGRSVQLAERSEAASSFAVREGMLQAQKQQLALQLEAQREAALTSLAITRRTYQALFAAAVVLCGLLLSWAATSVVRAHDAADSRVAAAAAESNRLRGELLQLELYRESLALDTGSWIHASAVAMGMHPDGLGSHAEPWGPVGPRPSARSRAAGNVSGACAVGGEGAVNASSDDGAGDTCEGVRVERDASTAPPPPPPPHPLLDPDGPLLDALRTRAAQLGRENDSGDGLSTTKRPPEPGQQGSLSDALRLPASGWWRRTGDSDGEGDEAAEGGQAEKSSQTSWDYDSSEPPKPWAYVHHAANLYALYVNEWIKHQTAQRIRDNIHTLLARQGEPASGADERTRESAGMAAAQQKAEPETKSPGSRPADAASKSIPVSSQQQRRRQAQRADAPQDRAKAKAASKAKTRQQATGQRAAQQNQRIPQRRRPAAAMALEDPPLGVYLKRLAQRWWSGLTGYGSDVRPSARVLAMQAARRRARLRQARYATADEDYPDDEFEDDDDYAGLEDEGQED